MYSSLQRQGFPLVQTNRIPTQGLKLALFLPLPCGFRVQTNRIPTQGLKQRKHPQQHPPEPPVQTNRIPTQGLKPGAVSLVLGRSPVQTNRIPTQGLKRILLLFVGGGGWCPNKQNPDSGIETCSRSTRPWSPAAVQTNRIPTQGLKQHACRLHEPGLYGPNKQNPDSGIETERVDWQPGRGQRSKQTESRLRD